MQGLKPIKKGEGMEIGNAGVYTLSTLTIKGGSGFTEILRDMGLIDVL